MNGIILGAIRKYFCKAPTSKGGGPDQRGRNTPQDYPASTHVQRSPFVAHEWMGLCWVVHGWTVLLGWVGLGWAGLGCGRMRFVCRQLAMVCLSFLLLQSTKCCGTL